MKSFIKAHRKSGSNPPEDQRLPVTPRLNHSSSTFSLKLKTPTTSPTLFNSTAFGNSPLPPQVPFAHSPTLSAGSASQLESPNGSKRSILRGFLKHKSSKSSLTPSIKSKSPVVSSFVAFSDPNLPLPSETPDFVVDRPHLPYSNSFVEERANGDKIKKHSQLGGSTPIIVTSSLNEEETGSSAGLENPVVVRQLRKLNTIESGSINISQFSFQSSKSEYADNRSVKSSDSSQFSFEANTTYGRSTSIKYYKKQNDLAKEEATAMGKKFMKEFIGEDGELADLNDDLNYDDPDVEDDTAALFSRKLFSSGEEDEADEDDDHLQKDYHDDTREEVFDRLNSAGNNDYDDDYLDEVNGIPSEDDFIDEFSQDMSDGESIGGEASLLNINEDTSNLESINSQISSDGELPAEIPLPYSIHNGKDKDLLSVERQDSQDDEIINNITKRMSQIAVELPAESTTDPMPNMGATQRSRLGLNLRTNSVKYHQMPSGHDDNLKFLSARYSWYVSDDDALHIQKKLAEMEKESNPSLQNLGGRSNSEEDIQFYGMSNSSSEKIDDSLLDEINQLPEDFDLDFDEERMHQQKPRKVLSNSRKNRNKSSAFMMAPSASTGTKIQKKDKTVTLFRSSSSKSKTESISSLENGLVKGIDHSDEDELSLITPVASLGGHPITPFNVQDSPLTTISEGSFDSTYVPKG